MEITMLNPRRRGLGRMIKSDEYSPPRLPPALIARATVRRRSRENGGLPLIALQQSDAAGARR
jgi:hypothetical protein